MDQGCQIDAMRQDQERGGMLTMAKGSRSVVVRRSADHPRASRGRGRLLRASQHGLSAPVRRQGNGLALSLALLNQSDHSAEPPPPWRLGRTMDSAQRLLRLVTPVGSHQHRRVRRSGYESAPSWCNSPTASVRNTASQRHPRQNDVLRASRGIGRQHSAARRCRLP